jgi:hypothetical protein
MGAKDWRTAAKVRADSDTAVANHGDPRAGEQLHGPFSAWNLVLTDQSLNNLMIRDPEAAALANFGNEKLSYSVTIQYFNNTKPEPAEYDVDEADVDEVKKWVGFYLGWKFQVSVYKWDGSAYREKLWDAPVEGDMPPVQGERIPPLTDRVPETLRAAADKANPITIDGIHYYPSLSQQALREELGVKQTRLQDARKTLEASGRIVVDPAVHQERRMTKNENTGVARLSRIGPC